jgi:hypothetical protein
MMVNIREIDVPPVFPSLWKDAQRQAPERAADAMAEFIERLGEIARSTKGLRSSANRSE